MARSRKDDKDYKYMQTRVPLDNYTLFYAVAKQEGIEPKDIINAAIDNFLDMNIGVKAGRALSFAAKHPALAPLVLSFATYMLEKQDQIVGEYCSLKPELSKEYDDYKKHSSVYNDKKGAGYKCYSFNDLPDEYQEEARNIYDDYLYNGYSKTMDRLRDNRAKSVALPDSKEIREALQKLKEMDTHK